VRKSLVGTVKRAVCLARGKKPMSTGYGVYKERCISEILSSGTFDPERLGSRYGVGLDERVVESPWLFSRLPSEPGRLLDAGSVLNFEGLLMQPALPGQADLHLNPRAGSAQPADTLKRIVRVRGPARDLLSRRVFRLGRLHLDAPIGTSRTRTTTSGSSPSFAAC
jgi:hypothetical protein